MSEFSRSLAVRDRIWRKAIFLPLLLAFLFSLPLDLLAFQVTPARADEWVIECADRTMYFSAMTDCSLQLDTEGHPHIVYGGDHLYCAWYDEASRHYDTVSEPPEIDQHASLTLNGSGYPHISYYDYPNHDLKYAYYAAEPTLTPTATPIPTPCPHLEDAYINAWETETNYALRTLLPGSSGQVSHGDDDTSVREEIEENLFRWDKVRMGKSTGYTYANGFRFTDLDIPQYATIVNATLSFRYFGWLRGLPIPLTIYAEGVDNSLTFTDANPLVNERLLTSASINWTITTTPSTWFQSPNLAPLVQEVVERHGWASTNGLSFIVFSAAEDDDPHYADVVSYDFNPAYAAKLSVAYRPPGTPSPTPTPGLSREVLSHRLASPLTLDGYLDEWSAVPAVILDATTADTVQRQIPSSDDASAILRSAWDENFLYFAVEIRDDVLVADSSDIWRDDSIELGIDGFRDYVGWRNDDHQFTLNLDGRVTDFGQTTHAITAVTRTVSGGWTLEVAITAEGLAAGSLTPDKVLGFTFGLHDDDDGDDWESYLVWEGSHTNDSSPEYGRLVLLDGGSAPPVTETATATPTQPAGTATPTPTPPAESDTVLSHLLVTAPTIDGHLGEWAALPAVLLDLTTADFVHLREIPDAEDASALLRSGWDNDFLYFAVEIQDDTLVADSIDIWRDDSIELGIDGLQDHIERGVDDHQFTLNLDGRVTDFGDPTSVVTAITRTVSGGWALEVAVTAEGLGAGPLNVGKALGFTFGLHDDDNGGDWESYLIWKGASTNDSSAEYGSLVLRDEAKPGIFTIEICTDQNWYEPSTHQPAVIQSVGPSPGSILDIPNAEPIWGQDNSPGSATTLSRWFGLPTDAVNLSGMITFIADDGVAVFLNSQEVGHYDAMVWPPPETRALANLQQGTNHFEAAIYNRGGDAWFEACALITYETRPTPTTTPTVTATNTPTPTSTTTPTPTGEPDLSASTKSGSPEVVEYFQEVTFIITLRNDGDGPATVSLTDVPPLPYKAGSALGGIWWDDIAGAIKWQGTLAVDKSRVFIFQVHGPSPPIAHDTIYTNEVTIDDGVHSPFVRSASVLANPQPTLTATPSSTVTPTATATPMVHRSWLPLMVKR